MRRIHNARARWVPGREHLSIEFGNPMTPIVQMYRRKDYFGLALVMLGFFSAVMFTMGGSFAIALSRIG